MLIAGGSLLLPFSDFRGEGFALRCAVSLTVLATTYFLGASRVIITFDEARMRVTVQRALLPFRGRVRVFDLATSSEARLVTDAGKVRFEIVDEHGRVDDAIVVRRRDAAAVHFVERVFAVLEARSSAIDS